MKLTVFLRALLSRIKETWAGPSTCTCYECGRTHSSRTWRCSACETCLHPIDWGWEYDATPHWRAKAGTRATLTFDLWLHQLNEAYAKRRPNGSRRPITDETGTDVWRGQYESGLTADEAIVARWIDE
jgi:hypothetical protein